MREELVKLLAEEVAPYLKLHGGDLELIDLKDHCAVIRLKGTCQHCSLAQVTVETVIKETISLRFPAINEVIIEPSSDSQELVALARAILSGGTVGFDANHKN